MSGAGPHRQHYSGLIADWLPFAEDAQAGQWKSVGAWRWTLHGADSVHVSDWKQPATKHHHLPHPAVVDAPGRLGLPIVFDLEIGHVPPHLPLVNGALATLAGPVPVQRVVTRSPLRTP